MATQATFSPSAWAEQYKAVAEDNHRNAMMDSGWSATTADNCRLVLFNLYQQLFRELQQVELKPEDFFDRPQLAAILSAVHEASKD